MLATLAPVAAETITGLKPDTPQPTPAQLNPGLAVAYKEVFVRHVDECKFAGRGKPGKPLANIDYNTGSGGVLTTDLPMGVCAAITGFIKFPKPGNYVVAFQSNDGVRLRLANAFIVEDPDVHSDRFSEYITIEIKQLGWYWITIDYFQRKGTATLEFYWQPPGKSEMEIVPASAFAHVPE